jgi:NADPH:quinone reductase-like Zn-dependent oxidoreductase
MSPIFPTHRLFNKNVLITGASGGIGAATGELFEGRAICEQRPYHPAYYR